MEDKGFNSFESNVIKLSVNEKKNGPGIVFWPGPALLFFLFRGLNIRFRARKVTLSDKAKAELQN